MVQSRADLRGKGHPDGWGIGVYEDGKPIVQRRTVAAFTDLHFATTAERIYSRTVIAHVRQATQGECALVNTHPFLYGCWMFAHNGTLTAFDDVAPALSQQIDADLMARRVGTTDTELCFYWILTHMRRAGLPVEKRCQSVDDLIPVIASCVRRLAEMCAGAEQRPRLNFLMTDGRSLVATRWNHTLYWVVRRGILDCEICGIPHVHHEKNVDYRAVVIASEPISHESWRQLPNYGLLAVSADLTCSVYPEINTTELQSRE